MIIFFFFVYFLDFASFSVVLFPFFLVCLNILCEMFFAGVLCVCLCLFLSTLDNATSVWHFHEMKEFAYQMLHIDF